MHGYSLKSNRILSAFKETNPELPITSSEELGNILKAAAPLITGDQLAPMADSGLRDAAKAVRFVLLEFHSDPELKPRLQAALSVDRAVLVEPITTALVMAGIVVVLQTRFKLKFKRDKNGKSEVEVSFEKPPSSEGIIKKILALF